MQNANHQNESECDEVLQAWEPPAVPSSLDQRVLASYRQQVHRLSWWQRFLTASIRVPMPIVALQAMLLLIAGGAFIVLFGVQSEEVFPLARTTSASEIIAVPVVTEKIVVRAAAQGRKQARSRPATPAAAPSLLPINHQARPALNLNTEVLGWQFRPDLTTAKLHPEWSEPPIGLEHKLVLPTSLGFKAPVPEPLRTEWFGNINGELEGIATVEKRQFFEGRISRTISRASGWVAKPFEKREVLYRWIPNALPAVNSFVAPAKNACFSPFRSKPDFVNVN